MRCPHCDNENLPGAKDCNACGKPLLRAAETFAGNARVEQAKSTPEQSDPHGTIAPTATPATPGDWTAPVTRTKIPVSSQGELEPGTVLGERYEIIALLGQGGMGAVYKAHDIELERLVALKIIRPELTTNPEMLRRFKQELILARQITHRNVVRIFDLGQADGFKFITMEYLEGKDLRAVLKEKGKLPPDEAARIILQICRALEVAHGEGVVHRDLKPQNIMLDANGRAYVMDFGIARSAYLPGMTQTGALIGTPEYMSPEQGKGEKLDKRSDLFSLGVICYELVTGQSPFYSETPLATLWKRMQEKAKPLHEVDPAIPKPLSDIVAKAMEIEPADRFASAGEMAQQLELWLGPSAGTSVIYVPAPSKKTYWKWVSAGLAVALVLGGVAFRFANQKPKAAHAPLSVLVADFTNHTGDPIFDGTLEPMFNVALEGASFVNAYSRGTARQLSGHLPHPSDKLDEQSARLVAISQGLGAVVTGSLSRRGDGYKLSVEALDARTGNSIATAEVSAPNKDALLLDVPKLAAPIRKALGDRTPESVQLNTAGGAFQAASLEAVHQYAVGSDQQFAGKSEESLATFAKVVELDPNFARAYSGMAASAANLGRAQDAEKYLKLAMEHVDRMTERERHRIRGLYYLQTENFEKCVEEYSELVKQYPADNIGYNNLSICYKGEHNTPKAIEAVRRSLEVSPNNELRANLALYLAYTGDFPTAEQEARKVLQANPSFEIGYAALAYAEVGQGKLGEAIEINRQLEKVSSFGQSMAAQGLADIALYEGRLADAARLLEAGATADLKAGRLDSAAADLTMLAHAQLLRKQKTPALAALDKALANSKTVSTRFAAARVYAAAGETAKARKLAEGLATESQLEGPVYAKLIEGEAAVAEKDPRRAIQVLNEANKQLDIWIGRFDLGRAYLDAGLFTEADSEFDRCIKRRGETLDLFDYVPTYSYFPEVYYYQGRAREGLNSPGFRDSYRTYLSIREKVGEDPLLPEIRQRLASH
jgi:eukaryotic-like serine/threonine-protein kinase